MDWDCVRWWFEEIAKLAPIGTMVTAIVAATIALRSIATQKSIARKRAAIDFFLKTETDVNMLEAWKKFEAGREAIRGVHDMTDFKITEHWTALRNYLNLHELMAVGIHQQVLDESVCLDFWRDELARAGRDCHEMIRHIQSESGGRNTYTELVKLNDNWHEKESRPKCSSGWVGRLVGLMW